MDIKDKLLGKKTELPDETPDDFELSGKAKEAMDLADDEDIDVFIRKKKSEFKQIDEKVKPKPEAVSIEETIEPVQSDPPELQDQLQEPNPIERKSNMTSIATIYLTSKNLESTKKYLEELVNSDYLIALQAGVKIDKANVKKVNGTLKYFSDNDYLVVVSAEKVEDL